MYIHMDLLHSIININKLCFISIRSISTNVIALLVLFRLDFSPVHHSAGKEGQIVVELGGFDMESD